MVNVLIPLYTNFVIALKKIWIKYTNLDNLSGITTFTVITFVIEGFLGMVTGILIVRLLGPNGRGEFAAIQNWSLVLGAFAGLGMSDAVIYFGSRNPSKTAIYLFSAYIPVGVSICLCIFFGWWLMPFFLQAQNQDVITASRWLLVIMMPLFGLFIINESLRIYGEWKVYNLNRIIPHIYWISVLVIAFVIPGWANPIVLSKLWPFMFIAPIVISIIILKRRHVFSSIRINPVYIKTLLGYSLPNIASFIPRTFNLRLDQLMMAIILPAQSLGLYVGAVAWSNASQVIFIALGQVLFPKIGSTHDIKVQNSIIYRSIILSGLAGITITFLMLLLTPIIIPFFFGESYKPAVPTAYILVCASFFNNLVQVLSSILRGLGKPKYILFAESFGLVITTILLLLLIPSMNIMGAGIASLVAYAGVMLIMFILTTRTIYIRNLLNTPIDNIDP